MSWVDNTIWWHLYPLGFVGAPIRDQGGDEGESHRLLQVIDWLDYATQLGLTWTSLVSLPVSEVVE